MVKSLPPLNAVRAFEAASRHLNLSRAAEELGVTQGAISKQVIALEDYIGVQLFIPWIIKTLIADVTAGASGQPAMKIIIQLTLAVLLVYILRGGMQFLRSYEAHIAGWGVVADVRKHIYELLQRLSLKRLTAISPLGPAIVFRRRRKGRERAPR